ncbi:MAG: hypothetical protein EZS28_027125, partial [Streblomastix strix]
MDAGGKCDPYVKVIFAGQEQQTNKVSNTLNAEYNQTFEFKGDESQVLDGQVTLELWDYDRFTSNELVGKVQIPLNEFKNRKEKFRYQFKGSLNNYGKNAGNVDLIIDYQPEEQEQQLKQRKQKQLPIEQQQEAPVEEQQPLEQEQQLKQRKSKQLPIEQQQEAPGTVVTSVLSCRELYCVDLNIQSDPYVRVLFKGQLRGKTRKATDTLHANYNESFKFHFDRETQDSDTILFELWERDALKEDLQIGKAEVPINYFLDNKEEAEITFEGVNNLVGQNVGVLEAEIEAFPYDDYFTMKRNQNQNKKEFGTIRRSYLDSHGQTLRPSTLETIKRNSALKQAQEIQQEQEQPIEQIPQSDDDYPKGAVKVTVKKVRNVISMDTFGNSDPYIKVILGEKEGETKHCKDCKDAEFNESFDFEFDPSATKVRDIQLELWDYDTIGDNDYIGKVNVPLSEFKGQKLTKTYKFKGSGNNYGQDVGEVDVEISYIPEEQRIKELEQEEEQKRKEQEEEQKRKEQEEEQKRKEQEEEQKRKEQEEEQKRKALEEEQQRIQEEQLKKEQEEKQRYLDYYQQQQQYIQQLLQKDKDGINQNKQKSFKVTVIGVSDIIPMDIGGKSDPYVKVIFAGQEQQTNKVSNTLNAEYNQTFEFKGDESQIQDGQVTLELWDYDRFTSNELVGKVQIPLNEFKNRKEKVRYQFQGVNNNYGHNVGNLDFIIDYYIDEQEEQRIQDELQKEFRDRQNLLDGVDPEEKFITSSASSPIRVITKEERIRQQKERDEEEEIQKQIDEINKQKEIIRQNEIRKQKEEELKKKKEEEIKKQKEDEIIKQKEDEIRQKEDEIRKQKEKEQKQIEEQQRQINIQKQLLLKQQEQELEIQKFRKTLEKTKLRVKIVQKKLLSWGKQIT